MFCPIVLNRTMTTTILDRNIHYLEGVVVKLAPCKLVYEAEQTGISLTWSETSKTDFLASSYCDRRP